MFISTGDTSICLRYRFCKVLQYTCPPQPCRRFAWPPTLRSAATSRLAVPPVKLTTVANQPGFPGCRPTDLKRPAGRRDIDLRQRLKTHLFTKSFFRLFLRLDWIYFFCNVHSSSFYHLDRFICFWSIDSLHLSLELGRSVKYTLVERS